jgi:hypothetical protein
VRLRDSSSAAWTGERWGAGKSSRWGCREGSEQEETEVEERERWEFEPDEDRGDVRDADVECESVE